MTTDQLRYAYERAQQLPDTVQNAIAERILDEIDNQEWEQIVSKPQVRQALRRMAAQARREEAAEETEEGGFGNE